MRIDVHAHYFPVEYVDFVAGLGRSVEIVHRPAGSPLDERIGLLDDAGIDLQVLSAGPLPPYFDKVDDAVKAARMLNDIYAAESRANAGRYAAFGSVPLPDADAAIEEAGRCLDELGMLGIALGCSVLGRPLDDPAFESFYAELDRRGAVVFLHPLGAMHSHGMDAYGLPWMVGALFEDTVSALRLVLSGLTQRYPNMKVIVPHMGGTLPFVLERLDYAAAGQRARNSTALPLTGNPSDEVKKLWLDSTGLNASALRCSVEAFGADRVMLGTDFPYLSGEKFKQCVTYVEQSGLPGESVDAILDQTAARLLGLRS